MVQFGQPLLSCSKQVALSAAEALDSLDGIVTGPPTAAIIRTAAMAWCRSTIPPLGYIFDEASVLAADGLFVVRPRDRSVLQPGRWLLFAAGAGPGAGCPPLSRELFVDAGTVVPDLLQDGSICAPFKTIPQAFVAAAALPAGPVTINATAGTYVLTATLTPPQRTGLVLRGSGETQTIIVGPMGADAFSWDPNSTVATFDMSDLTIRTPDVARSAFVIDDTTVAPNTALADGLTLERVNFDAPTGAVASRFTRVGQVLVYDSRLAPDDAQSAWLNCSSVGIYRTKSGPLVEEWEYADPGGYPGLDRLTFLIDDSSEILGVTINGHPKFIAQKTARLVAPGGGVPYGLQSGTLTTSAVPPAAPAIGMLGSVVGDLLLAYPDLTGLPGAAACSLTYGEITGSMDISVDAASAIDLDVDATFGRFPGSITAGRHTNIDLKWAYYEQANLSAPGVDGSIDRILHELPDYTFAAGDPVIPITPRFPAGVTAYVVGFTQTNLIGGLLGNYWYDTKTNAQFTAHKVGAFNGSTVDVRVTRVP